MPTLPAIIAEKEFAENMTQVMDVMKGIALASFIRMKQVREERFEQFVKSFDGFFQITDLTKAKNPFIKDQIPTVGYILITSDEAFMGGINFKVASTAVEHVGKNPFEFMVCGSKGAAMMKSMQKPYTVFTAPKEDNFYQAAVEIKDYIVKQVKENNIGKVYAVFVDPVSFTVQKPMVTQLLPAHDIYDKALNEHVDPNDDISKESSIDMIMDYLVEIWITYKLYSLFEDNKMAEFAAQSIQLDGSLQNLTEMNKKFKLLFVKTRREVIDASLREVVAARMVTKEE